MFVFISHLSVPPGERAAVPVEDLVAPVRERRRRGAARLCAGLPADEAAEAAERSKRMFPV